MGNTSDRSSSSSDVSPLNSPTLRSAGAKHRICKDDIVVNIEASLETPESTDDPPIIKAAIEGDRAHLDDLIKSGASVNAVGISGQTALSIAAEANNAECIDSLIKAGADVNSRESYSCTPLMFASKYNHIRAVKRLLNSGADVNAVATGRETALFYAAKSGQFACVELLLRAGAAVNIVTKWGRTALYEAVKAGYSKCAELLICEGADVNTVDRLGRTVLYVTAESGHEKCVHLLIESGADFNLALELAVGHENDSSFELLVKAGNLIPGIFSQCKRPMIYAAESGHLKYLRQLRHAGADVNVAESYGNTPLIRAALNGHDHCVEFLLEEGADVNHSSKKGNTALMAASFSANNVAVVKRLLLAGARVNVRNKRSKRAVSTCADDYVYGNNVPTLLFVAGEQNVSETFEFADTSDHEAEQKLCLMNMCRVTIRKQLIHVDRHAHFFSRIPKLGLPPLLTSYLLYNMKLE